MIAAAVLCPREKGSRQGQGPMCHKGKYLYERGTGELWSSVFVRSLNKMSVWPVVLGTGEKDLLCWWSAGDEVLSGALHQQHSSLAPATRVCARGATELLESARNYIESNLRLGDYPACSQLPIPHYRLASGIPCSSLCGVMGVSEGACLTRASHFLLFHALWEHCCPSILLLFISEHLCKMPSWTHAWLWALGCISCASDTAH